MRKNYSPTQHLLAVLILIFAASAQANVRLPKILANNMVLQQNTKVNLWGWADSGEVVKVSGNWNKDTVTAVTGVDGKWRIKLQTPAATSDGTTYFITIIGKNKKFLTGILFGEVWLLSGQSNMEIPMSGWPDAGAPIENSDKEIAAANYPRIRFIVIGRKSASTPQSDFVNHWTNAAWTACSPNTVKGFSAVGYFFGRDLFKELNVPIGMVLSAWGGSSCEAWTSAQAIENVTDFQGKGPWSSKNSEDNVTPTVLYNGMIAPLIPFTFAGVLWYQGETNAWRAEQLTELFPAMIKGWRDTWQQQDLPFYFAQLAPWGGYNGVLPSFWEAQASALTLANTGMVVTLDVGDAKNIHPGKKEPIGQRFALWAKAKQYGQTDLVYSGPLYKSMQIEGNKIRIAFQYAENGLKSATDTLRQFEIAGENNIYYPASAQINGNDILVWNNKVLTPKNVRYAWTDTANASLYNNTDLPAAAFRTNPPAYLTAVKSSFQANPLIIYQGESCTLSWLTKGAPLVTFNGEVVGSGGTVQVTPDSNTTYTLVAAGKETITKSITVHVIPNRLFNRALNQPVSVSSVEVGHAPADAVDGNIKTRWSSEYRDPQWISIDLGESIPIERVILHWEAAYGKTYEIQISDDATTWKTIFTETNGDGEIDDILNLSITARYIRMNGLARGTQWGYSLWEFAVYSPARGTGVGMNIQDVPGEFKLIGNYPNPFNNSTKIAFYLPKLSQTTLAVYNVQGQLVSSIISRQELIGAYTITWNAPVTSGMYFCRIEAVSGATNFSTTRKMMVLR